MLVAKTVASITDSSGNFKRVHDNCRCCRELLRDQCCMQISFMVLMQFYFRYLSNLRSTSDPLTAALYSVPEFAMPDHKNIGKLTLCYGVSGVHWTIAEFLALTQNDKCYISSPFPMFDDSDWHLKIFPNGIEGCDGWLSLYLVREAYNPELNMNFEYTIGLKRLDGTYETIIKSTWEFSKGVETSYGHCKFLERSELLKRRSELLPSGALTVTVVLRENEGFDSSSRLDLLSDNLADMLISQRNCDVVINVSSMKKIPAHKFILSARSPVFAAMLENNSEKDEIDIDKDCHADSFEDFVRYLYCGRIENLSSYACQLYRTAERYEVWGLRAICTGFLLNNLTLENLCDAVLIAFQREEPALMEAVKKYFTLNLRAIIHTGKWASLLEQNRDVANQLLLKMASQKVDSQ